MARSQPPAKLEIDHMVDRLLQDPATARLVAQRLRAGLAGQSRVPTGQPPASRRAHEQDMDDFWDNLPV